ncbi:MAG TPA: hypothetical protein VHN16_16035, partial [Streptosporangiaceae bacterium]|nr:hypothetical protein [Streptosporangiaceae bacterium]
LDKIASTDGTCLAVRLVGALDADQKLHRGNRGDRGIVNAKDGICMGCRRAKRGSRVPSLAPALYGRSCAGATRRTSFTHSCLPRYTGCSCDRGWTPERYEHG